MIWSWPARDDYLAARNGAAIRRFEGTCRQPRSARPRAIGAAKRTWPDGRMGIDLHDYQTTLQVARDAVGHRRSSAASRSPITFIPADADTGIVFRIADRGSASRDIPALVSEVGATDLCTVLGDPAGQHVATVEHLMAALFGARHRQRRRSRSTAPKCRSWTAAPRPSSRRSTRPASRRSASSAATSAS